MRTFCSVAAATLRACTLKICTPVFEPGSVAFKFRCGFSCTNSQAYHPVRLTQNAHEKCLQLYISRPFKLPLGLKVDYTDGTWFYRWPFSGFHDNHNMKLSDYSNVQCFSGIEDRPSEILFCADRKIKFWLLFRIIIIIPEIVAIHLTSSRVQQLLKFWPAINIWTCLLLISNTTSGLRARAHSQYTDPVYYFGTLIGLRKYYRRSL